MKRLLVIFLALFSCISFAQHQAEVRELLKSRNWDVALRQIKLEGTCLAPDLILSLEDVDPKVKARAAHALRVLDSYRQVLRSDPSTGLGRNRFAAVEALVRNAKHYDAKVRRESVWALAYLLRNRDFGHHGEPWSKRKEVQPIVDLGRLATPALLDILYHQDPNDEVLYAVKIATVRVLAANKDPRAVDGLISVVKNERSFLLSEAMSALTFFDDPQIPNFLIENIEKNIGSYEDTPGIWALRQMGHRAVPALVSAIAHHPNPKIRAYAAHVLEHVPDARAIPSLQKATSDSDEAVRIMAVSALSQNPHNQNLPILLTLLSDSSDRVRKAAITSLRTLKIPEAFDAVSALLKDKNDGIINYAVWALPELDKLRAVPVLIPLLKDLRYQGGVVRALKNIRPNEAEYEFIEIVRSGGADARREAATLLGEMKSIEAVPALLDMIQEDDAYAIVASEALGQIGKPSVPGLLTLLRKPATSQAKYVLQALGLTRDPQVFEAIVPYLQDKDLSEYAISALGDLGEKKAMPLIIPFLSRQDHLLYPAVETAGKLKSIEAVPFLIKALNSKVDYVASAAARALGIIGDRRALEPLLEVITNPRTFDRQMAIEALSSFPDHRSIPILAKIIDEEIWPDTFSAIEALGLLGDPAALPVLEKAALSEDETYAEKSREAIEVIRKRMGSTPPPQPGS